MKGIRFFGVLLVTLLILTAWNGVSLAQPVEIDFFYGLGGFLGEVVEDFIARFNASQDEVRVTGITFGDFDETLHAFQASIAAQNPPAAAMLVPSPTVTFATRGILEPLNDFMAADPDFDVDDYVPAFMDLITLDGNIYALPLFGTTQVLYYRKDLFAEAGINPNEALKTWEGLSQAAAQLTQRENGEVVVYGWEPMWGRFNMMDAVFSRGGQVLSDDGTKVLIDSPIWVETWDAFRKWIHEDEIMRIHYGGVGWEYWYRTIDDVLEGRAAGYTGSSGDQGDLDFQIVAAHPQPGWERHVAAPVAEARYAVVPSRIPQEEQEAAFQWLAFFTSPAMTAEWNMKTGYMAVRLSAREDPTFKAFVEENPQALVPLTQAETASTIFLDPTGGLILQALDDATDMVQIQGIPAAEALGQAAKIAQEALDRALR